RRSAGAGDDDFADVVDVIAQRRHEEIALGVGDIVAFAARTVRVVDEDRDDDRDERGGGESDERLLIHAPPPCAARRRWLRHHANASAASVTRIGISTMLTILSFVPSTSISASSWRRTPRNSLRISTLRLRKLSS